MEQNTWKWSCLFSIFVKYLQAEAGCETFLCALVLQMDLRPKSQVQRNYLPEDAADDNDGEFSSIKLPLIFPLLNTK